MKERLRYPKYTIIQNTPLTPHEEIMNEIIQKKLGPGNSYSMNYPTVIFKNQEEIQLYGESDIIFNMNVAFFQKNQNEVIYLDNNFNEIRNSITNNNKMEFNQAFDKLKTDIDTYTQSNYNTIISMKDQEIERWKKEEKLRKEREDQELKALIHAYDTSLSMGERENAELKKRLKELEGFFI